LIILPDEEYEDNDTNHSSSITVNSHAYPELEDDYDHKLSSEDVYEFEALTTADWEKDANNDTLTISDYNDEYDASNETNYEFYGLISKRISPNAIKSLVG
jgi:hypothetical protein